MRRGGEGGGGRRAESNVGRQFDGFFELIVRIIDGFVYPQNNANGGDTTTTTTTTTMRDNSNSPRVHDAPTATTRTIELTGSCNRRGGKKKKRN